MPSRTHPVRQSERATHYRVLRCPAPAADHDEGPAQSSWSPGVRCPRRRGPRALPGSGFPPYDRGERTIVVHPGRPGKRGEAAMKDLHEDVVEESMRPEWVERAKLSYRTVELLGTTGNITEADVAPIMTGAIDIHCHGYPEALVDTGWDFGEICRADYDAGMPRHLLQEPPHRHGADGLLPPADDGPVRPRDRKAEPVPGLRGRGPQLFGRGTEPDCCENVAQGGRPMRLAAESRRRPPSSGPGGGGWHRDPHARRRPPSRAV